MTIETEQLHLVREVDSALALDQRVREEEKPPQPADSKIAAMLRAIGAGLVVLAAITFLLQRWDTIGHIERYFAFLGFTGILCASGLICGLRVHDAKGARVLLAITAACVTVNFCQLGALIYSRMPYHEIAQSQYMAYLVWKAPSNIAAIVTGILGLAALIPLTYLSFSVLTRAQARIVTVAYLAANAMLILPTRNLTLSALMIAVVLIGLTHFDLRYLKGTHESRTFEGKMVRIIMSLPLLALTGRTLQLYYVSMDTLCESIFLTILAYLLFEVVPRYGRSITPASQLAGVTAACGAWINFAFNALTMGHLGILTTGMPLALLVAVASLRSCRTITPALQNLGSYIAVTTVLSNLTCGVTAMSSFIAIATGVVLMVVGYSAKRLHITCTGVLVLIAGVGYHLRVVMGLYEMFPWISIGVLGIGIILLSSLFERHRESVTAGARHLRAHFARNSASE